MSAAHLAALLVVLVVALTACAGGSTSQRDETRSAREVLQLQESRHEVVQIDSERGAVLVVDCEGAPLDCAQALEPATDAGPRDAGRVHLARRMRLPIGADPRLPPAPGPAAPAERERLSLTSEGTSTAQGERDESDRLHLAEQTHHEVVSLPWWVFALGALALFVAIPSPWLVALGKVVRSWLS